MSGAAARRPAPDTLLAEAVPGAEAADRLRSGWQALFEATGDAPWSCAPEVHRCWIATLRPPDATPVIAVRDAGGALRGVMPLMRDVAWRGPSVAPRFDYDPQDRGALERSGWRPVPVRQLASPASLPATMLWTGPLCRPGDLGPVMAAVAGAIRDLDGWDVAVLPAFEGAEAECIAHAMRACGQVHLQPLGREVMNLSRLEPFAAIVARQPKKFRQNLRRATAAGEAAGLRITFAEGSEGVARARDAVEAVARASWKAAGRTGAQVLIPYDARQKRFFERLMTSDRLGGVPVVGIARDAEGPVAVLTMLHLGPTVTALLTFWNGRLPQASPGLQLIGAAIDHAVSRGATRFATNTTSPWARYFTDERRVVTNIVTFRDTPYGRALARLSRWRAGCR